MARREMRNLRATPADLAWACLCGLHGDEMRRCKIDDNQPDIVKALRAAGCSVEPRLARVGGGAPDILVGHKGVNYTLEVKDGSKPPSARKLTADEVKWHREWRGQVAIVNNITEALAAVGLEPRSSNGK